jgi:hypothetical protein
LASRPPSRTPITDAIRLAFEIRQRKRRLRLKRATAGGLASGQARAGKSKRQAIIEAADHLRARGLKERNIAAAVARKLRVTARHVRDVLKGK